MTFFWPPAIILWIANTLTTTVLNLDFNGIVEYRNNGDILEIISIDRELCSGPSKLCQALAIDKSFDQRDLAEDRAVWLERSPPGPSEPAVVAAARVGIGHAGEWAQKPLRFYLRGSPWVSVVDRAAEQNA
ncbi:DNA-3-methyladenine glycosylase-like [Vulpes vulpes]|uniref:DNA-3-methyladenine glycosylase II n=1 Tax=Vulpes vulpes TaxID=9627 RepID=A0ABM4XJK2_VULVU